MKNEEIVRRFVEAKAIDFKSIGAVISELGPHLAVSDEGFRGVLIGRPFILACFMPAGDLAHPASQLGEVAKLNVR